MKICHDAAHSDLDPLDLTAPEFSLTVGEAPVSMEMPFEPTFNAMPVMGEMHDYELGQFLSEAFDEPDAAEGLTI